MTPTRLIMVHHNFRSWITATLSGAVMLMPGPTLAQSEAEMLVPLEACTPIYAVQKRSCTAQRFYRCNYNGQPILRAESIEEDGIYYIDFADMDGNTISAWSTYPELSVIEVSEMRKAFSRARMMEAGEDNFDLTWMTYHPWFVDPVPEIFSATLRLTGQSVTVNDVEFKVATMKGFQQMNAYREDFESYEYFDLETGAFLWGAPVDDKTISFEPLEVIRPEDPRFALNYPFYECGALSYGPRAAQAPKG